MWLCPVCFNKCTIEFCVDCQQPILIEERYGLKHCVKIIPRMCFEAWDKEKERSVYLYQGRDDIWYIVPSPDDIDIKSFDAIGRHYSRILRKFLDGLWSSIKTY